jgi:DNA polymerase I-like protein with 3'-5' exonuclease and polymerase domains
MRRRLPANTMSQCEDLAHLLLRYDGHIGFDTESSGPLLLNQRDPSKTKDFVNMYKATLTGFSLYFPALKTAYYVPMTHKVGTNAPPDGAEKVLRALSEFRHPVAIHNVQHEILALRGHIPQAVLRRMMLACTMIICWLVGRESDKGGFALKDLAALYLGIERPNFKEVTGGRSWDEMYATAQETIDYACADAEDAADLFEMFEPEMAQYPGMTRTFWDVEMPHAFALRNVEDTGWELDRPFCERLEGELRAIVEPLEEEWEWATGGLNYNSPKQLQTLFENGTWDPGRVGRTKSGALSTDGESLEALAKVRKGSGAHLAKILLSLRESSKLLNTYAKKFIPLADQYPSKRLHCNYTHVGTRTGRLSSSYPNMTNVPARSEAGKRILEAFVPPPGFVLLSADYSQIELRTLAHLAGRGALFEGYRAGADVHQITADHIGRERADGKTVNFAAAYGAGPFRIAQVVGCSKKEATRILDRFWNGFEELKLLKAHTLAEAEEKGYVSTLLGRIRHVPELKLSGGRRWYGERIAFNCFDYQTEVLTRRGWKDGHEVQEGDELLTKNAQTGALEWQAAEFTFFPNYDGDLHVWKSRNFSAATTPNHRWLVNTKGGLSSVCRTTETFRGHGDERIHRVGDYIPPERNDLSDEEIEMLGWAATDASHRDGRSICIMQSKPETCARLEVLLPQLGFQEWKTGANGLRHWFLGARHPKTAKYLALVAGRVLSLPFLWSLTKHQARILLRAVQAADGERICAGTRGKAERYQILASLAGYHATITERQPTPNALVPGARKPYYVVHVCRRSHVQVTRRQMSVMRGSGVWCPSVPNTYVLVRKDGHVYVTGQTPIQGSARDIVALAMNELDDLAFKNDDYFVVGQVHDDILAYVREGAEEEYAKVTKEIMEGVVRLGVPLVTEPAFGKNWREVK